MCINPRFLEGQLAALTGGAARGPIAFALAMNIESGPGAALHRLCLFLLDLLERDAEACTPPLVLASLGEAVARALLLGHDHNHAHLLAAAAPSGPQGVRLAEEYADAHAGEPIGVGNLAAVADTSVLALEAGFRAHRSVTPRAFLRARRLALARAHLLEPEGAEVDVARGAGFLRRQRFEAAYAADFGETPGETRARGLVAGGADGVQAARLATLTPREREVCERVSRGMLTKQIAAELRIGEKMTHLHRTRGMAKLGVGSAAELGRLLERLENER